MYIFFRHMLNLNHLIQTIFHFMADAAKTHTVRLYFSTSQLLIFSFSTLLSYILPSKTFLPGCGRCGGQRCGGSPVPWGSSGRDGRG